MTAAQQELIDYMAARSGRHVPADNELARLIKPVCVFALMLAGGLAFNCLGSSPQGYTVKPGDMAGTMAEKFVRQDLLCPATAQFSLSPEVRPVGDAWQVTSYVDSQNAFGANIRRSWTATVKQTGDKWQLLKLEWK